MLAGAEKIDQHLQLGLKKQHLRALMCAARKLKVMPIRKDSIPSLPLRLAKIQVMDG